MADKTDYHSKPVLQVRVPRESLEWAREEAGRRGQPFGDYIDGLITSDREHARPPEPPVPLADEDERPQQAGRNCKHKNMTLSKGVCPDCKEWVTK